MKKLINAVFPTNIEKFVAIIIALALILFCYSCFMFLSAVDAVGLKGVLELVWHGSGVKGD